MNKIDWTFMQYCNGHDYEKYKSMREKEIWKLAKRKYGVSEDDEISNHRDCMYISAHLKIDRMEMKRLCCNNYRKRHGIPMKRRKL